MEHNQYHLPDELPLLTWAINTAVRASCVLGSWWDGQDCHALKPSNPKDCLQNGSVVNIHNLKLLRIQYFILDFLDSSVFDSIGADCSEGIIGPVSKSFNGLRVKLEF